uniref:Helicase ATP-binding domain-containing protein n=1 Tax=Setaria italica TaxID=4555 RepID=K3ZQ62_SETIT
MAGFDADADDFASPSSSAPPAPRARADGGVYQVGGVPVEFPYKPYGTQLAFMGRVIATLDRARRQGQSHALLESPTGTGKSLSLLCSALAWQRHYPLRSPPAAPTAAPDPFLHGGGFVADDTQPQATPVIPEKPAKKKNTPTIYYATRTHAQITQVVREYRKTSYRVRMAILASRKHYCVNKLACMSENIDEQWNAQKLSRHPSLQIGGCYEVHDIEDLVRVGRKVKGCPYFAAQHMAEAAQLVFCPYNYLISPIVRRAMDIDIGGSIIILDEAHNIEDTARDAGSVDVDEESLYLLQGELQSLVTDEAVAMIYQPLHDVIQGLMGWISEREDNLQNHEFGHPASYWAGEKAMKELQLAGITPMNFPVLQECATKAVKAASDTESDGSHLSGGRAMTLESLFSSLSYFFANNGRNSCDYQLALQRFVKKEGKDEISSKCTLSLWCLNPAVVFREIADLTLSVILTSGTLSPMGSFASELGVQFEACLEAPHVINVDSQVFAAVLSSGPTRHKLNASYKTADCSSFQDELGTSLEEICRIVPGGALVFFPSYKLLDKLQVRWSQTGQWARLNAQKHVFVEMQCVFLCLDTNIDSTWIRNDVQVKLKKRYNDSYKSSKYLLSGSEWYCHQAFRALNQAAGRCIRHKSDYGGIILIDERYQEDRNLVYISKWLRNAIKQYNSFQDTMDGLQKFFQNAEEKIKIKDRDMFPKIKLESEALSSLSDKRKLPWPELSSSNHSAPQKNQKAKTECLSQKVTNIDGVAIDQKKVGVADTGANYEVKTEIISFEKDDFEPRYKITILNPLEGRSQQPTPVEETSLETPVASPSNYSEINISAGINNGTLSCLSTLAATPERTTNRDCHESLINRSVNSHCEKKRRLSSPMSFCAYSERSNSPGKSQLGTDNAVTIEHGDLNRNAELFCKNMSMSRCENVKLERNYSAQEVSEKMPSGKKLLVSCIRCKTALGLEQDGLLVTCSRSSSSKFYLAYLLRHGLSTVGLPEDGFSASTPAEIQVVECDASSLNQNIFGKFSRQGSCHHSGVWSAKDGCVYKAVICPFCSSENACATILGVQVLATDKPNQQLVGKVLLFGERLDVKPEPSKGQASRTRRDGSNSISSPPVIDLESLAYKPLKKDPVPLNSRRSKFCL